MLGARDGDPFVAAGVQAACADTATPGFSTSLPWRGVSRDAVGSLSRALATPTSVVANHVER